MSRSLLLASCLLALALAPAAAQQVRYYPAPQPAYQPSQSSSFGISGDPEFEGALMRLIQHDAVQLRRLRSEHDSLAVRYDALAGRVGTNSREIIELRSDLAGLKSKLNVQQLGLDYTIGYLYGKLGQMQARQDYYEHTQFIRR